MSSTNFVIVTFVDENDAPGIVASNWIINSKTCYYPNVRTEEMKNKLLKVMTDPEITWPQYHIRILKSYETYGEARLHLKQAEETSNLDSDVEVRTRKRKIKKVYLPGDSSGSSDEYPLSKVTQARKILSTKRNENLKYPTPPSPAEHYTCGNIVQISNDPPSSTVNSCPDEAVNCLPGCTTCKQFSVQQTHVIQVVTDLTKQVGELNKKVDLLLGRSSGETCIAHTHENAAISDLLASLPVKDDESFDHLNNQLQISQNRRAIMTFLAGIGGRNVRSLTNNMLRRILLDDVAELYSLTGKQMKNSSKKSFLHTETFKLIFQICKKGYGDVTENDLKQIIGDWLNQAKVRITRRAERQNKEVQNQIWDT